MKRLAIALGLLIVFSFSVSAQPVVEVRAVNNGQVQPLSVDGPLVRVKDIARVQGVRDNQLYGLGLVIGLEGTGDSGSTRANVQMIANMLEKFGITVSADDIRVRNVAAVMVTADVPSSVRSGDRIDVTVSSIGDARNLQGGYLLQTPLEAANGQIYAAAQGPLSIGGFNVRSGGAAAQRNHSTVALIPNGGIIERDIVGQFTDGEVVTLVLQQPDFATASRLASVINQVYAGDAAMAVDQSTVRVEVPAEYRHSIVGFIAELEELPIRPDTRARVIINERTGTVVMGSTVRIAPIAVAHGNLSVKIEPNLQVSQPPPLSEGDTMIFGEPMIEVEEERNRLMLVDSGSSVQDLIDSLNAIGVSPRDMIAILQAIKAAGALYGELIIL